eukprot:4889445-Alexandrium_andersonii.AAC.1
MSASLVGSEMCIRDSTGTPLHGRPRTGAVLWAKLLTRSSVPSRSVRAVSYTHLTLPTICSV